MSVNVTNSERAKRCFEALIAYGDDGLFTNLIDFLADAMHFCDESGESFDSAVSHARSHYLAKLNGEHTEERRMP